MRSKMKSKWVIIIKSNNGISISNNERNFIINLIDNEGHTVEEKYSFILHNVLEDNKSCEAIIEGNRVSVINIVMMLKDNLQYNIFYRKISI